MAPKRASSNAAAAAAAAPLAPVVTGPALLRGLTQFFLARGVASEIELAKQYRAYADVDAKQSAAAEKSEESSGAVSSSTRAALDAVCIALNDSIRAFGLEVRRAIADADAKRYFAVCNMSGDDTIAKAANSLSDSQLQYFKALIHHLTGTESSDGSIKRGDTKAIAAAAAAANKRSPAADGGGGDSSSAAGAAVVKIHALTGAAIEAANDALIEQKWLQCINPTASAFNRRLILSPRAVMELNSYIQSVAPYACSVCKSVCVYGVRCTSERVAGTLSEREEKWKKGKTGAAAAAAAADGDGNDSDEGEGEDGDADADDDDPNGDDADTGAGAGAGGDEKSVRKRKSAKSKPPAKSKRAKPASAASAAAAAKKLCTVRLHHHCASQWFAAQQRKGDTQRCCPDAACAILWK